MPIIELDPLPKNSEKVDDWIRKSWININSIMHYPEKKDAELRKVFYSHEYLWETVVENKEKYISVDSDMLHSALNYEQTGEAYGLALSRGHQAGFIMLNLCGKATFGQDASINMGIEKVIEWENFRYGIGSKTQYIPKSRTEIKKSWKDFKNVSHLWAAYILSTGSGITSKSSVNDLKQFLATANNFLKFATEYKNPKAKSGTILDNNDVWHLPRQIDFSKEDLYPFNTWFID